MRVVLWSDLQPSVTQTETVDAETENNRWYPNILFADGKGQHILTKVPTDFATFAGSQTRHSTYTHSDDETRVLTGSVQSEKDGGSSTTTTRQDERAKMLVDMLLGSFRQRQGRHAKRFDYNAFHTDQTLPNYALAMDQLFSTRGATMTDPAGGEIAVDVKMPLNLWISLSRPTCLPLGFWVSSAYQAPPGDDASGAGGDRAAEFAAAAAGGSGGAAAGIGSTTTTREHATDGAIPLATCRTILNDKPTRDRPNVYFTSVDYGDALLFNPKRAVHGALAIRNLAKFDTCVRQHTQGKPIDEVDPVLKCPCERISHEYRLLLVVKRAES